jgi:hypothetical protein
VSTHQAPKPVLAVERQTETTMNTIESTSIRPRGARSSTSLLIVGAAVAAVAIVAVVALGGRGSGGSGAGVAIPSATPSSAPSVVPSAPPSTPPSSDPSGDADDPGSDAMPLTVDLRNATGAAVRVDIVDRTGLLLGAESGTPGDGMSVEPNKIHVENIDARTLKLTWVDFPIDNALALFIDETAAGYRLLLIQPEPTAPTDAIGFDRELVLSFSEPVSVRQIQSFLQGGLDTSS